MSSKTRTRTTRTASSSPGSTRALRAVPDQPATATAARSDTEDKLWKALHAHPNSTAADLSAAAEIGKSTAQKILARWEGERSVTRTPGITHGGRRAADLWAISEIDTAATPDALPDTTPDTAKDTTPDTAQDTGDTSAAIDTVPDDERTVVETAPASTPAVTSADTPADEQTTTATGDLGGVESPSSPDTAPDGDDGIDSVDTVPSAAVPAPVDTPVALNAAEGAAAEVSEPPTAEAAAGPAATDGATPDGTPTANSRGGTGRKGTRLAAGALRGMVEDHLRDHPGAAFSPVEIARALGGKSSGAVSNALDKLVTSSVAVQVQDKPKRFALAPTEQDPATDTPAH